MAKNFESRLYHAYKIRLELTSAGIGLILIFEDEASRKKISDKLRLCNKYLDKEIELLRSKLSGSDDLRIRRDALYG